MRRHAFDRVTFRSNCLFILHVGFEGAWMLIFWRFFVNYFLVDLVDRAWFRINNESLLLQRHWTRVIGYGQTAWEKARVSQAVARCTLPVQHRRRLWHIRCVWRVIRWRVLRVTTLLSSLADRQLLNDENRRQALDVEAFSRGKLRRDSLFPCYHCRVNVNVGIAATFGLEHGGSLRHLTAHVLRQFKWVLKS